MAKDAPAEPAEPAPAAAPARPGRAGPALLVGVAVAALAGAGGAAWLLMNRSAPAAADAQAQAEGESQSAPAPRAAVGPPHYLSLTPAFVVNLANDEAMRYLQVDIEVMARDPLVLDLVKTHMPVIRNDLLLLFGQQRYEDLESRAGKEKLQAAALAEVQRILLEETGKSGVEALYFTSLVMQ
jgi:flagellar protein FliL